MERLENKIAVITGASTGIGQASAVALAIEGAHVLALDISDQLEETVQSINDNGGKATAYRVTFQMINKSNNSQKNSTKFGHVDVIFNNAGVIMAPDVFMSIQLKCLIKLWLLI